MSAKWLKSLAYRRSGLSLIPQSHVLTAAGTKHLTRMIDNINIEDINSKMCAA